MDIFLSQPVDYQQPLNRGLRSWVYKLPSLQSRGMVDLCRPSSAIVQTSTTIDSGRFGTKAMLNTSSSGLNIPLPSRVHGGVSATLAILARNTGAGANQRLVDTKGGSDDYYPYSNTLIYSGALRNVRVDGITNLVTMTNWFWTYWTTDGSTWTMYQKQVNGPLQVASTAAAESTVSMPSTYFAVGHDGGGGQPWIGNFQGVFLWNRCLPAREIHAHTIEWQQGFPNLLKRVPYSSWFIPVGGTAYTLTAAQASFTLTGQSASLLCARKLTAAQASFTLNGQAANTLKGFKLTAAQASFTLSGQAASFSVTRKLTAAQATFTLTGQAAALQKGFTISAAQASFTLSGQAASLKAGLKLTAAQASFTLTGQSAGLYKGKTLTAVVGTFTLTGQASTLKTARILTAGQTTFTLAGQSSSLLKGRTLTAGQVSFTLTGQSAALSRTYNLACQYGTLTLSGQAATLTYSAAEPEEDEEYTINYLSPQDNSGYTLQSISPQDTSNFVELERGPTPG